MTQKTSHSITEGPGQIWRSWWRKCPWFLKSLGMIFVGRLYIKSNRLTYYDRNPKMPSYANLNKFLNNYEAKPNRTPRKTTSQQRNLYKKVGIVCGVLIEMLRIHLYFAFNLEA